MPTLTILLALIAASLFALGTVLQQRIAMTAADRTANSPWFMLHLARHPVWLAGIACTVVGFFFHAGPSPAASSSSSRRSSR